MKRFVFGYVVAGLVCANTASAQPDQPPNPAPPEPSGHPQDPASDLKDEATAADASPVRPPTNQTPPALPAPAAGETTAGGGTTTAAPVTQAGPAEGYIACITGSHPAEWPDSARTATSLVCEELRKQGIHVTAAAYDAAGASSAYVVHLDQLGTTFFLRVEHQQPIGNVQSTRRLAMSGIEETEFAAPRIAQSFATGQPLPDTQKYDNLVGSESRRAKKKKGEFVFGAGAAALTLPSSRQALGPALNLFIYYETLRWAVGLSFIVGDGSTRRSADADYFALGVGARYFFLDSDLTPFVGGGLTQSALDIRVRDGSDSREGQGSGVAAFAEVGLEAFRLHSAQLIVALRADAPFYSLERSAYYDSYRYGDDTDVSQPSSTLVKYDVPMTLTVGIGF